MAAKSAKFEIYRDRSKQWRWRLVARNGRNIADSGESYENRDGCVRGIKSMKKNAPAAEVVTD